MGGVAFKENRNIWEVLTFAKIDFHFTKCVLSSHCGRPRAADVKTFWVQSQRHHPHSQRKSAPVATWAPKHAKSQAHIYYRVRRLPCSSPDPFSRFSFIFAAMPGRNKRKRLLAANNPGLKDEFKPTKEEPRVLRDLVHLLAPSCMYP